MSGKPLEGLVVLDLGQIYNAPYATLLMALAGPDRGKICAGAARSAGPATRL